MSDMRALAESMPSGSLGSSLQDSGDTRAEMGGSDFSHSPSCLPCQVGGEAGGAPPGRPAPLS